MFRLDRETVLSLARTTALKANSQPIQIGWRDVGMIRTAVLRLCGQASGAPSGLLFQSYP
jgi:hypothetical protein